MDPTILVLGILSVGAASLPLIALLGLLVWMDRYEREPLWLVALVFVWGAVGAIVFALLGSAVLLYPAKALLGAAAADTLGTVLVAPLIEEPAKALVLLLVVRSKQFDNPTDGFLYGAAAGLGFGMTENFMYFVGQAGEGSIGGWLMVVFVRTLFSAPMHACATALIGMSLGFAKFRNWPQRFLLVPLGMAGAVALHMMWNGLLVLGGSAEGGELIALLDLLLMVCIFVLMFAAYQFSLWRESKLIERELGVLAAEGILPNDQVRHLSSWSSRTFRKDWIPPGVAGRPYIETATLLAFRRFQARARPDQVFYETEVERLLNQLKEILAVPRSGPGTTSARRGPEQANR
jgi:RsiW-degrading membrane proteinase PrsW (M82 family)